MDSPIWVIQLLFRCLQFCPIIDEIDKCLRLDRRSRHVFQFVRPKLYSPLGNPASRFPVLDYISQGSRTDHCDGVSLEVLLKLSACHKNSIHQLLPMRIPLLGLNKYLADIVNQTLNRMLLACLLRSTTIATLTARALAATYSSNGSLPIGAASTGGLANCR